MSKEEVFSYVAGIKAADEWDIDKYVAVKAVMNVLGMPLMSAKDEFKRGHRQCLEFLRQNVPDSNHEAKERRRRLLLWATEARGGRGQSEDWSKLMQAINEMAALT
ncbi:hypothetical protein AB0F91_39880 [Amycolatopsis sp. NPDC023774]|uniref:hypothetical protein n=1 Tax=Amycolatopsis sp. NPDC023774 TaxID=3155015 RepID=UPI0034011A57